MSTSALILGGIAILLLLNSSSDGNNLIGGAKPAGTVAGARTYGPAAPLPPQAPSGSPGGQTQGGSTLGALYTNVLANADRIGSGIGDIIAAARATDDGSDDAAASPDGPPPLLARDSGSGGSWIGFFNGGDLPVDPSTNAPDYADIFGQDSSFDAAFPDWNAAISMDT